MSPNDPNRPTEADAIAGQDAASDLPAGAAIPAVGSEPATVDLDTVYGEKQGAYGEKQGAGVAWSVGTGEPSAAGDHARAEAGQGIEKAKQQYAQARESLGRAKDQVGDEVSRRYDEVRDFTHRAGEEGRRKLDEARVHYEAAKRELGSRVVEYRGVLGERTGELVADGQARLCGGVNDLAAAARAAAGELRNRDDVTVASYADAAADSLERLHDFVRSATPSDLVGELASLTRRRPEWVLGGAFVIGLGLSRLLKADRPHARPLPAGADEHLFDDLVTKQRQVSQGRFGESFKPTYQEDFDAASTHDLRVTQDDLDGGSSAGKAAAVGGGVAPAALLVPDLTDPSSPREAPYDDEAAGPAKTGAAPMPPSV